MLDSFRKYRLTCLKRVSFSRPVNKSLIEPLKRKSGRSKGRLVISSKGGGHKKHYRKINFFYNFKSALIKTIEYDPNRSAFIMGCSDLDTNKLFYFLQTEGQEIGGLIGNKKSTDLVFSNGLFAPLGDLPLGSLLNSVSLGYNKKAIYSRSAGTFIKLLQKDYETNTVKIRLPSKIEVTVPLTALATVGAVSNPYHKNKNLSKAGRSRWLGNRPSVRGVAKNPVDHPHGGGEGKTSGGRPSVTPWGRITKGQPTRKKKQY